MRGTRASRPATASWWPFLSYDDLWHPHKLERQAAWLAAHPEAAGCVCHVRHFLDDRSDVPTGFRTELLARAVPGFIMEALLVRRSTFNDIGLFDTDLATAEDVDWFARLRARGLTCPALSDVLLDKRVHQRNHSPAATNSRHLLRAVGAAIQRHRANR